MCAFLKSGRRTSLLLAVGLVLVSSSCRTTRVQTVEHTIEYESTVNQTTEEIANADTETPDTEEGTPTYPVIRVQDSTGVEAASKLQTIPVYTVRVGETQEGKDQIEITTDSTVTVYRAPVGGEVITIFQDTLSNEIQAVITGEPGDTTMSIDVAVKTGVWFGFGKTLMWLFFILLVLFLAYITYTVVQWKKRGALMKGTAKVGEHILNSILNKRK